MITAIYTKEVFSVWFGLKHILSVALDGIFFYYTLNTKIFKAQICFLNKAYRDPVLFGSTGTLTLSH